MNLNVLLLEDNKELAELQIAELEKNCYRVTWCKSLKEFNEAILEKTYLMVISDLNLPDGNSLNTLKNFKLKNLDTPVLVQTGDSSVEVVKTSFNLGVLSFLEKPFKMTDVTDVLDKYEALTRLKVSNPKLAKIAKLSFKLSNI